VVFEISVVITSILRLHSLYVVSRATDITWYNVGAATWSAVEVNVGIICACLPTLRPLIGRIFPSILASSHVISHTGGPSVRRTTIGNKGTVRSNVSGTYNNFGEYKMGNIDLEMANKAQEGKDIRVTTTFAQEVERRDSSTSSERKLVWNERERASERSF